MMLDGIRERTLKGFNAMEIYRMFKLANPNVDLPLCRFALVPDGLRVDISLLEKCVGLVGADLWRRASLFLALEISFGGLKLEFVG